MHYVLFALSQYITLSLKYPGSKHSTRATRQTQMIQHVVTCPWEAWSSCEAIQIYESWHPKTQALSLLSIALPLCRQCHFWNQGWWRSSIYSTSSNCNLSMGPCQLEQKTRPRWTEKRADWNITFKSEWVDKFAKNIIVRRIVVIAVQQWPRPQQLSAEIYIQRPFTSNALKFGLDRGRYGDWRI